MPNSSPESPPTRRNPGLAARVFAMLASFNIAIVVFAFMIIVTFTGSWLQKEYGLYDCQRWYFESWITPREAWLWGWLPLPGMALLLAVMFVNVLCGGIIRIRKSKRTIGVVISHMSMLGFIIAGGVSLWYKTEGMMRVFEGGKNSIVAAHQDWVIEVRELTNAAGEKPPGDQVFYFREDLFRDCGDGRTRTFFKSGWPFEIKVGSYVRNAAVVPGGDPSVEGDAPRSGGYALRELAVAKQNEMNAAGVMVKAVESSGATVAEGILAAVSMSPIVFECAGGRRFSLDLTRERWEVPFTIQLDDFRATYYPGTKKAKEYESDIRVLHASGRESKHRISMNNPLRDAGYVAYQTSFDSDSPPGQEKYSVFTVVKNRSDQWPLYSLIVCAIGLSIHFLVKLTSYLKRSAATAAKLSATS